MKKINYRILIFMAAAMSIALMSCRQNESIVDDLNIPGLGGYVYEKTALDEWLDENYLIPYNIQVLYHWEASQQIHTYGKKLVPVKVENVQPMMAALARVWFDPYLYAAPYGFLQQVCPKTIVLTGSPEYDNNGTITLGQAEGARKIWLTNVNFFDPTDIDGLKGSLHVIEHEFTHVLHQTKKYDSAFEKISTGKYNASAWSNLEPEEAYGMGFISPYASNSVDEDFAEMVSRIMVYGLDWFENTVIAGAANPENGENPNEAVKALRAKAAYVEKYMKEKWGISYYDTGLGDIGLVTYVQDAIADLIKNP